MDSPGIPLLSLHDPDGASSTSLDPLGLTPIGEQLAVELFPGVRERQSHPRYLTAIAVGHAVCDGFPDETLASDGVSEPWQVFEWYVVEGFVRCAGSDSEVRVPGSRKARTARDQNLPLCASRYLKSPSVFGFHGVYRLLARTLRVEQADHLADFGFELLDVWQKEQGLPGFSGTADGTGRAIRQQLREAVKDGLSSGATARSGGWTGWQFMADHLEPTAAGPKEAALLWRQLQTGASGYCAEVLGFLVSREGRALFKDETSTEKLRYAALRKVASGALRERIDAIRKYEAVCRLLHDAFEACRYEITQTRRGVQPSVLGELRAVRRAVDRLPAAFGEAEAGMTGTDRQLRFRSVFQDVAQTRKGGDFVNALFDHHRRIQKAKPPEGKAPWIEQHFDGSWLVRPEYQLDDVPQPSSEFVNPYRLSALWSFARDLRQV